jgi:hypothetical protein
MRVLFLFFRNNYRKKALGNFVKTRLYGKYFIINLSGVIKFFLFFNLIKFLKFGKIISIDGNPLVAKQVGINFWLTGTHMKILEKFRNVDNNYVNLNNPILKKNERIFQIYPIINNKWNFKKNPKIIYMGKFVFYNEDQVTDKELAISKILEKNYTLLDDNVFWSKNFLNLNEEKIFEKYRIYKTLIREKIIENIDKCFGKYFEIYLEGNPKVRFKNSRIYLPNYNMIKIKNIYQGNFCLDTGSIMGSSSLYPRSIQILESSGFILQNRQHDSSNIWGNFEKFITFSSSYELNILIEKYLSDSHFREEVYFKLRDFNKNNLKKIENSLNKVFN